MKFDNTRATRILLVDDHAGLAHRISQLLAVDLPNLQIVPVLTGEDGLALALAEPFDLVLLDVRLPGRGGIDVLRELRTQRPALPVIIISSLPEVPYAALVQRAGAIGFVTKSALPRELVGVVKAALADSAGTAPS